MSTQKELDDFQLSGSPSQKPANQTIEPQKRPKTPPNLSKNQAKKWRKKWDFEEKQRIKQLKSQQQQQNQKQKQKQKQKPKKHGVLPQYDNPHTLKKTKKAALVDRISIDKRKQISMFAHLPQHEKYLYRISTKLVGSIHPVIVRAGLYYNDGTAWGANTRCIIMLNAFSKVVAQFECPSNNTFARELLNCLNQSIQFLNDCRPQSVSMGNTIRWLKTRISEIDGTHTTDEEQKRAIIEAITEYVFKIETADKMISVEVMDRIRDDDVILTYARSYVVEKSLIRAYNEGNKRFSVVIVDARPHYEGKYLLSTLSHECPQMDISYTLINSASYVMSKNVNKVILGAACIMSNGSLVSRNGTATICCLAKLYKIPVMVCCETYKFSERVQIDSICSNELGDFDALVRNGNCEQNNTFDDNDKKERDSDGNWEWRNVPKLKMLNLKYDTTPSKLIRMVITELGVMPPSAAPVIVRECHKDRQF